MIELKALTKRYGAVNAVEDISLTVGAGEIFALVGGSGSGKTTTLKMINRLIEPSSGEILIDGQDVTALPPHELRRRIGYVFQKVGLFPHMTVAENIGLPSALVGWDRARIGKRVDELLRLVELDPTTVRHRFPAALSGGEQQRVGVARALATESKVMLLDEPFGALDPITRDHLQVSFKKIREHIGLTAIFVTHDMAEALLLGDRIGVMRNGRLIQVGTPRELLLHPSDNYVRQMIATPVRQSGAIDNLLHPEDA